MKEVKLDVQSRTENDKISELNEQGFIPAVLYGLGIENVSIKVKRSNFDKVFSNVGKCGLIDLSIDGGEAVKVLVKDLQKDILKDKILHVDFYQVKMDKKVEVEIPINFFGEAKAVKEMGGNLVRCMDFAKIKCLPGDLVSEIRVNLSALKTFDDCIRVKDLDLGDGMEVVNQSGAPVINVLKPKVKGGKKKEETKEEQKEEEKTEEPKEEAK